MSTVRASPSHASLFVAAERVAPYLAAGRPSRSFRFGPFLLHPERQLLLNLHAPVRLGGRAFDLLTVLVERAGELVNKQELMLRVWPDTFVEEGNLKVNISGLRRALGECSTRPRFIATVVGRGYRFVAPVDTFTTPWEADGLDVSGGSSVLAPDLASSAPT